MPAGAAPPRGLTRPPPPLGWAAGAAPPADPRPSRRESPIPSTPQEAGLAAAVDDGAPAVEDVPPSRPVPSLEDDVRGHLLEPPRSLPPKYLYDRRGSDLFDRICLTPEYYVTRTEEALLARVAGEVADAARPATVFEFGSGTSRKTPRVLEACLAEGSLASYAAFDISPDALRAAGRKIRKRHPGLGLRLFAGDYTAGLDALPELPGPCLFLFLGGTIGNFPEPEGQAFLRDVAAVMGPDDSLLIGADRVKDPAVLDAAYNDAEGVTAAFNLNALSVLNDRLGADFRPRAFRHDARYVGERERVELRLVAEGAQRVRIPRLDAAFELADGETILTEISRKFTPESLARLLGGAGLAMAGHYAADGDYFSLVLARRAG